MQSVIRLASQICQSVKERNFDGGGGLYTQLGARKVERMNLASVIGFQPENQVCTYCQ
jgi:hypothetical protein